MLPENVNLLIVAEHSHVGVVRTLNTRVPSLLLNDDEWQTALRPILARAELIVSEFTLLSRGVKWELEQCVQLQLHHKTVLVLPPRSSPFSVLDHRRPIDMFCRVSWADQFFSENPDRMFVFAGLLRRIAQIASCSVDDRMHLYSTDGIGERFPISYSELFEEFKSRAHDRELASAFGADSEDEQHYRFWDYFRWASTIGVLVKLERRDRAAYRHDFVYTYIMILQGLAHGVVPLAAANDEDSFLNWDTVVKIAETICTLIRQMPPSAGRWMLSRFASLTFDRLGLDPGDLLDFESPDGVVDNDEPGSDG